jgi:HEAT repeat protein
MANGQRNLWIAVVLALLGGFAWVVLRPHEPVFEGKPLSVALDEAYRLGRLGAGYYGGVSPPGSEMSRVRAERALRALGTNALPILVEMAGARRWGFREVVGEMAREPSMGFLHLPPQEAKHEIAVWGMALLGKQARPAVPALARLLSDKDPGVQLTAARCLAGMGPEAAEAVPALVRMLESGRRARRYSESLVSAAARTLGEIGPAASAAIPSLEQMTNEFATVALIKIGRGSFQPFFERLKDTSDPGRWYRTAIEVWQLGTNADPAIPLLLAGLQHTNGDIRRHAALVVGRLHRQPDLCVRPLASLLESTNKNLRFIALDALGNFGPAAKPVAPEIARCLSDREPQVRSQATNALRRVAPDAPGLKAR